MADYNFDDDEDIEDMLRKIPPVEYPPHLKSARKAEFVTGVRKYPKEKKPGCRDIVLLICCLPFIIGLILQIITTWL